MQFRSYTYDSTEIDIQYALDSKGREIKEIQLDEAYTGDCFPSFSFSLFHAHVSHSVALSSILNISPEGGEWYIKHRPSRKVMLDDEYEGMVFYLIIERKPLYYVLNIILPCILITIIAIFNFYLPPDAGIPISSLNSFVKVLLPRPTIRKRSFQGLGAT